MSEAVVTFQHLRRLQYCGPGIRRWCQQHGVDAREFRKDRGVPVSRLRATGCRFASRAADLAEGRDA